MDVSNAVVHHWYVIFRKTKLDHWVFRWLDREFHHVFAVKESPGGEFWMVVDGKNSCTEVTLLSKIDYPHVRLIEPDSIVLSVNAVINPEQYRHTLCVFTCVELVKSLLGIRDFWCWTPYQLYKRLSRA